MEIKSNEAISLDETKQLKYITGMSLDGKNIEDLSVLKYFKAILVKTEDLSSFERLLSLSIKNNERISTIEDDIYSSLFIENSKIKDINNLTNLTYLNYKGSELPEIENLLDKLKIISIDVTSNLKDITRDENSNIILPNLLKLLQDRGFEIEANICDQVRDEQYLNSYNKNKIDIVEDNGKLIINYEDIKNIIYEGSNQFIEIKIKDLNNTYMKFDFKYIIKYKLFDHIELDTSEAIKIEDDTVPDLSNLTVYKVYSNKEKIKATDFIYSKEKVTRDMKEIEISYAEDTKTSKCNVPIIVTEHVHEWGEWRVTREPTEKEDGQKERICLKNDNHKEIARIDKLPEVEYKIVEGKDQIIKNGTSIDLKIKINADHELFDKLLIDDKIVDSTNYTITKGSTIITISANYLKTLNTGTHTIEALYKDGKSVETSLTITNSDNTQNIENNEDDEKAESTQESKNNENTDNNNIVDTDKQSNTDNNNSPSASSSNPKTGDNIVVYIIIAIISVIGIVVVVLFMRRKQF